MSTDVLFGLLIHCRNYDGFPGRALRDDVITVTVNYGNSSNANLGEYDGVYDTIVRTTASENLDSEYAIPVQNMILMQCV